MRSVLPIACASIALTLAAQTAAADLVQTRKLVQDVPLVIAGSLWVDNPIGSIDIVGTDRPNANVTVYKTVRAADRGALDEGFDQTVVSLEGDQNVRLIRTLLPPVHSTRWTSSVAYTIRVPRTVHVRVGAKAADNIRVANIGGNVTVKSFNGTILLDSVSGASIVDTVNGKVIYVYRQKPIAHAQIQAVSADIEIHMPPDSNVNWVADTLKGDVQTNLPVRTTFVQNVFRGTINAPGGPTLTTQSLLGNIAILGNGIDVRNARSLWESIRNQPTAPREPVRPALQPSQRIQAPIISGPWAFRASVADVEIGEVRGPARVDTGAGEVKLGFVYGDCQVTSMGGPLDLGDIMGTLIAHTGAGDVLVRSVKEGGEISTDGGIIRLLYTGGPTTLKSGGGDIVVRQAAGPVIAETHSGDITITADSTRRTQHFEARTSQGNIVLNVSPNFAADIDATVITSDPDANAIHSDFTGLNMKREQFNGKTRIRATGKLNGGGEKVELYVEDGDIHITNVTTNPVTLMPALP